MTTQPDFDTLVPRLRRWTKDHDTHVRAAVELPIWHEHWLRRADFTRECVHQDSRQAWIDWRDAREFVECGARASTSEMAILDLAVALGENRYRLSIMGDAHAKAIVKAFATALAVEVPF
jgi:hypothetical protein